MKHAHAVGIRHLIGIDISYCEALPVKLDFACGVGAEDEVAATRPVIRKEFEHLERPAIIVETTHTRPGSFGCCENSGTTRPARLREGCL